MVEVDDRQILQDVLCCNTVMGQPVGPGFERARDIELAIDLGAAIMQIVVRRVAPKDGGNVPVRVDASVPSP